MLMVIGVVFGIGIGIGLEFLLRIPLGDLLPNPLPSYGYQPIMLSVLTSVLIGVPALGIPLVGLVNTSAISVIQSSHQGQNSTRRYLLLLVPVVPMLLMYGNNLLVWIVLGGIVALFAVLALVSILVLRLIGKLRVSTAMRLAISRINRTPIATGIQFGALALSLMLLSIIWLVRSDLLSDWQQTLPENAPNAFALNIADYEKDAYLGAIDANNVERTQAFPIIRGRLTTINGVEAGEYSDNAEDADVLSREINFTWGESLPEYNEVTAGQWTTENGVSVESEVADQLGLKIGDELSFTINSQRFDARVNTIRKVEWREMKPNFYFIFTPDVLSSIPSTWLVSFRLQEQHDEMLSQLSRNHPTVSLMDIRKMGALRDPDGANLDRIQVVKGWLNADGTTSERVHDVACGGRDISDGACTSDVGNTVNAEEATYTNSIGQAVLAAYWEDPDFDPEQSAFYYVRVIEIPTPRWTTFDAKVYGVEIPEGAPVSIQERAYSSPIWYAPS